MSSHSGRNLKGTARTLDFSWGRWQLQTLRVKLGKGIFSTSGVTEIDDSKSYILLDVSCRKKGNDYYIVTDRWQKFTSEKMDLETLNRLVPYCDEFLIHAVDVEGKASGIEKDLAAMLGDFTKCPVTYAGGVGSFEDLRLLKELGKDRINVTIASALDLFGGPIPYERVKNLGTNQEGAL